MTSLCLKFNNLLYLLVKDFCIIFILFLCNNYTTDINISCSFTFFWSLSLHSFMHHAIKLPEPYLKTLAWRNKCNCSLSAQKLNQGSKWWLPCVWNSTTYYTYLLKISGSSLYCFCAIIIQQILIKISMSMVQYT